jgi:hypothetical protein
VGPCRQEGLDVGALEVVRSLDQIALERHRDRPEAGEVELVGTHLGSGEPARVERRLRREPGGRAPHAAGGVVEAGRRVVERTVDHLPRVRARFAELLERAQARR